MKLQLMILTILLSTLWPAIGYSDVITRQVIDFRDDAEEEITGPNAGNVFRSSSDLEFGNQNGVEQWVGLRFQDVTIPQGSTVLSVYITMTATTTDVGTLNIPIFGELEGDTVNFGDATPLTTRNLTQSSIDWNVDPWFPGDTGANTTTPNLAAITQEVVNLAAWNSGNSMVFLFRNDPLDTSERIAVSYDGDPTQAAVLTIEFETVPEPTGGLLLIGIGLAYGLKRQRSA